MSTSRTSQVTYDDGIECTPDSIFKGVASCFGLLLSSIFTVSLSITAAGLFWTAQSMYALTHGDNTIIVSMQPYIK